MTTNDDAVRTLNSLWTTKRALIDQYVARSKVQEARGDPELAKQFSEFAFAQMREVSGMLDKIVELGGIPQLQAVEPVPVGETADEQLRNSIEAERSTVTKIETELATVADPDVASMIAAVLEQDRARLDWLEAEMSVPGGSAN